MTESTPKKTKDRVVLGHQNGELSEFAGLLSGLGVVVDEMTDALPSSADLEDARLVVVSGKRLLEAGMADLSQWPRTIAVIDDASKTLVSHLSRTGAAMVIRRPIHPRALRLLLLHEIYRGPERRGRRRVLIGHPIRVSQGLFRPHATLLELSPTGARVELANPPKVGANIKLLFGKDLAKTRKPVKLHARVIRAIRSAATAERGGPEIGVTILDAAKHARVIKGILDRYFLGPAQWDAKGRANDLGDARTAAANETSASEIPITDVRTERRSERSLPPNRSSQTLPPARRADDVGRVAATSDVESDVPPVEPGPDASAYADTVAAAQSPTPASEPGVDRGNDSVADGVDEAGRPEGAREGDEPRERRQETRIPYDRRIVALGEEAARVLVGRDLSRGGMRIETTPAVNLGDALRVALHSGTHTEPIVVVARAIRDDGEDGMVLSFDDLSPGEGELLDKIIASSLPLHESADEFESADTSTRSVVVAEMIETISTAEDDEGLVESEEQIEAHLDSVFDTSESVEDTR